MKTIELPPYDAPEGMYWWLAWDDRTQENYWELKPEKDATEEDYLEYGGLGRDYKP